MNKINKTLFKRIVITIVLYLIYRAGFFITLLSPLDKNMGLIHGLMGKSGYSLFALGILPALSAFFLVEILFLLIPPLRVIRNSGFEGRKIIYLWSLLASIVLAAIQSWAIVRTLAGAKDFSGLPLIMDPTILVLIIHFLFFIVGFALLLFIGNLISKHGIGNGFCIMIGVSIIIVAYKNLAYYFQYINLNNISPNFIGLIVFSISSFFIGFLIKKKNWKINIQGEYVKSLQAPFFIQGAAFLTFPVTVYGIFSLLPQLGISFLSLPNPSSWGHAIVSSLLSIVSSLFGYWIFSSKKRIASNLNISENSIVNDNRPLFQSTCILFFLTLFFVMPFPFWEQMFIPTIISLLSVMILIAIGCDFYSEWMFHRENENSIEVCELDNVYLAATIKEKLENAHIGHCVQGYEYRRLYFFFQPLIKMKLLVSKERHGEVLGMMQARQAKNI